MDVVYGKGIYIEGDKRIEGQIVLGEYKLFLKSPSGDLTQTYVPLDKIERVKKISKGIAITIRPSLYFQYVVKIESDSKDVNELLEEIVKKRDFKKLFLKKEWIDRGE